MPLFKGEVMSEDDKKAKVINLMQAALKQPRRRTTKPAATISLVVNAGDGDGHGIGNTIIKTERHVTKTIAEPRPGIEHITEDQVRKLHDLKDEIVRLEALGKQNPATPGRVWSALNKKMRVGAMRMIPLDKFSSAQKYLQEWIGQLSGRPAVQKKDPEGIRKRRIGYIQGNMKKMDCEADVRDYMEKHFSVRSLTELPDAVALERVYRYVAGRKKEWEKRAKET